MSIHNGVAGSETAFFNSPETAFGAAFEAGLETVFEKAWERPLEAVLSSFMKTLVRGFSPRCVFRGFPRVVSFSLPLVGIVCFRLVLAESASRAIEALSKSNARKPFRKRAQGA